MKKYEIPEIDVEVIMVEDVITTSGDPEADPETGLPIG